MAEKSLIWPVTGLNLEPVLFTTMVNFIDFTILPKAGSGRCSSNFFALKKKDLSLLELQADDSSFIVSNLNCYKLLELL